MCHLLVQMVAGGSLGIFGVVIFPLILGIYSALTIAVAAVLGMSLYSPLLRRLWQRGPKVAGTVILAGAVLFGFGLWSADEVPALEPDADPDTQEPAKVGVATYPGLLLAVFAVLHWPARDEKKASPTDSSMTPADSGTCSHKRR